MPQGQLEGTEEILATKCTEQQGTGTVYKLRCPEQWERVSALNFKHSFRLKTSQLWQQGSSPQTQRRTEAGSLQTELLPLKRLFSYKRCKKLERTGLPGERKGGRRLSISRSSLGFQNREPALELECQCWSPKSIIRKQIKTQTLHQTCCNTLTCTTCRLSHGKQHTEHVTPRQTLLVYDTAVTAS